MIAAILSLSQICCFSATVDAPSILTVKISRYVPRVSEEFLDLCMLARTPCGIEITRNSHYGDRPFHRELLMEETTVLSILEKLAQGPWKGYSWSENEGVLDIGPKVYLSHTKKSPLEQRLPTIDFSNVSTRRAIYEVCERSGVASYSRSLGLSSVATENISLHLKSVTVREALDALIRADGNSAWVIEPLEGAPMVSVYSYGPRPQ